jgi:hypothetical protein
MSLFTPDAPPDVQEPAAKTPEYPAQLPPGMNWESYLRKASAAGTPVTMGDGKDWLVPAWEIIDKIPDMKTGPDGEILVGGNRFADDDVEHGIHFLLKSFMDCKLGGLVRFDYAPVWKCMLKILQRNYDITPEKATELRLFPSSVIPGFFLAVAGEKKGEPSENGSGSTSVSLASILPALRIGNALSSPETPRSEASGFPWAEIRNWIGSRRRWWMRMFRGSEDKG